MPLILFLFVILGKCEQKPFRLEPNEISSETGAPYRMRCSFSFSFETGTMYAKTVSLRTEKMSSESGHLSKEVAPLLG